MVSDVMAWNRYHDNLLMAGFRKRWYCMTVKENIYPNSTQNHFPFELNSKRFNAFLFSHHIRYLQICYAFYHWLQLINFIMCSLSAWQVIILIEMKSRTPTKFLYLGMKYPLMHYMLFLAHEPQNAIREKLNTYLKHTLLSNPEKYVL